MAARDDIENSITLFLMEVKKNTGLKPPIFMALMQKDVPVNGVMSILQLFHLIFLTIYMKRVYNLCGWRFESMIAWSLGLLRMKPLI